MPSPRMRLARETSTGVYERDGPPLEAVVCGAAAGQGCHVHVRLAGGHVCADWGGPRHLDGDARPRHVVRAMNPRVERVC
eukprot:1295033-Pyramimonas_sp.AAC.1